jgi:hypothetical protein
LACSGAWNQTQEPLMNASSRYVLIKGKAGLGNRLLCALTGILYARIAGRRAIVDWRDFTYSDDGSNAFPKLFSSPYVDGLEVLNDHQSVFPALWKGHLDKTATDLVDAHDIRAHYSFKRHWQFSFDLRRIDYDEDVLVMWSFSHLIDKLRPHFRGEFAHLKGASVETILSWLLETSITLDPAIQTRVADWWRDNVPARPVIGVHVRFMDRAIALRHFTKHLDQLVAAQPEATVFLATDNAQVSETVRTQYANVVSTAKWFPSRGRSMHQNPDCPDRLQSAIDALTDMYLLARCDYLVYPRSSTFSYISRLLSKTAPNRIIDAERYHAKTRVKRLGKELYLRFA